MGCVYVSVSVKANVKAWRRLLLPAVVGATRKPIAAHGGITDYGGVE
jgi:hypothetical protein